MYAIDPCISINIFWKDLPDEFYEKKDLYGNKVKRNLEMLTLVFQDLIPGFKAMKEAESIVQTLQQLPEYYREFYARTVIANIKSSFSL